MTLMLDSHARFDFLKRAVYPLPLEAQDRARHAGIQRLRDFLQADLLELARRGSPDDFAEIYLGLEETLERFATFAAYPAVATRALVAFAGGFSAGKSSLINALLGGKRLLPVEIDPTTSMPAYVLQGASDAIWALNLYAQRIPLDDAEFASLTHDEQETHGTQIARLLKAAFVTRQAFPWEKLALIDTPGFCAGVDIASADAERALAQLDAAQAVVWVASMKKGTLGEDDLAVLARLRAQQPRLIALTHADQVADNERERIVTHVQEQLTARNLPFTAVLPVSRHPKLRGLLEPLLEQLSAWQTLPADPRFAHRFKGLLLRYQRGLEQEQRAAERERYHLNRLAACRT